MENDTKIDALNELFSIPGITRIVRGNGDLPKIAIETKSATAEIYLYGAQVTAWKPADGDEVLFVSEKSYWEAGRAIRGGIPVCFPWFRWKANDPHAPSHGFVRTKEWQVESVSTEPSDCVRVCLSTASDESTRRWWPFEFRLEYRITVGMSLRLELEMENCGSTTLRFEEALHTYFKVSDVERVRVRGLDDVAYLDNCDGNRQKTQRGDLVLARQTDNAYQDAIGPVEIMDPELRRILKTEKQASASTIVWNPWSDGASSMADLGDREWRGMLCAEGANIGTSAIDLSPGQSHSMTITIRVAGES
ncbi:MAG: D-hexose-6-phosphate mutarotase [Terracidiphilus sp.]